MSQGLVTRVKTTRRLDAEAGVNLSKRRTWFADDPPPAVDPPGDADAGDDNVPDWVKNDPAKAYKEIQKLRRGEAEHRSKAADAQKKLDERVTAEQQAEQKKLVEQNEFKTLYEKSEAARIKAEADAQVATIKALRVSVAVSVGLPVELATRLQGANEEELKADAEALKALIPASAEAAPGGPKKPNTTLIPGGPPAGETDAQRRARLQGGGAAGVFSGGNLIMGKTPGKT